MPHTSERREKPRRRAEQETEAVCVAFRNGAAGSAEVRARVIDWNDAGMQIESPVPVEINADVIVSGAHWPKVHARVVRCSVLPGVGYNIGLAFEEPGGKKAVEPVSDYYEVLQVHSKAEPETIHRVYRLLAQRFHPDNAETGDAEAFRGILNAYKVLSDPEKRAAYDVHLQAYRQMRWRLFDQADAAVGKGAEKCKRRGVLDLLYTARMNQPTAPTLNLHELEDLLGCPREHLEFALWYLRENSLITKADNGRLAITAKGVDHLEANDAERLSDGRLLPAAAGSARG
jgi:hypothetical protein